jgi:hypothetical protein
MSQKNEQEESCNIEEKPCNIEQEESCNIEQEESCNIEEEPCNIEQEESCNIEQEEPCNIEQEEPCNIEQEELCDIEQEEPCNIEQEELCDIEQEESCNIEQEEILNIEYEISNKNIYSINIPPNIFQTWNTKKLPPKMYYAINVIRKNNPGFRYYLFDDNDCRKFIKNNFDKSILYAFDSLIPGAYKADLWRYCILYKYGGIYLDVKYYPINGFKLVNLLKEEHWVLDADKYGIYNALMVCKAGNELLLKAINKIVDNVKNKFYGVSFLEPTGPRLLGKYFSDKEKNTFKVKHIVKGGNDDGKYITFNNLPILRCYSGYFNERSKYSPKKHYAELWKERHIYL